MRCCGISPLSFRDGSSSLKLSSNIVASGALEIRVERARGDKCERCWKYRRDVGSNEEFPTVCGACASVLPEFLESGA